MTEAAPGDAPAVWLLALGQTLTYAGLYYAFAALVPALAETTGWTKPQLAAGPTLGFLVTAALTPFTGRLVDRGLGGELLIAAPLLGAAALAGLALTGSHAMWLALWAVVGVAQAGCLYETCFAFLTRRLGSGARAAITRVTLVAGLASTLAFPLGNWLAASFGGQGALAAFAVLVAGGAVPANAVGVRRLRRRAGAGLARPLAEPGALSAAFRRPAFWMIAGIFGLIWLNHSVLITYALILFADRGATPALAVLAASAIGPSQVAGRLVLMLNEARIGNARATVIALGSIAGAAAALWLAGLEPRLIFGFAVLQGAGAGLLSILRPVLQAEILGRQGFGTISGAIAISPILATAAGPSVGAFLLSTWGAEAVYAACLVMAAAGLAVGLMLLRWRL